MASPVWHGGTWANPMGTDWQGYDVLSRLVYGARTSLAIGLLVVFVAGMFGVLVGLFAGYRGGRTDRWLMGWVDVQVSFPGLLLAMLLIALVGGSDRHDHRHPRHQRVDGLRPHDARNRALRQGAAVRRGGRGGRLPAAPGRVHAHPAQPRQPARARWPCSSSPASSSPRRRSASSVSASSIPDVSLGSRRRPRPGPRAVRQPVADHLPGILLSLTVLAVNLLSSWLRVVLDPQEREKRFAASAIGSPGSGA